MKSTYVDTPKAPSHLVVVSDGQRLFALLSLFGSKHVGEPLKHTEMPQWWKRGKLLLTISLIDPTN